MNRLETEIVKAIGKYYPVILSVVDSLNVSDRELTGAGSYINFKPLSSKLNSKAQVMDLHGTIELGNDVQLSAHVQLIKGMPKYLEICCLSKNGWNGYFSDFQINN